MKPTAFLSLLSLPESGGAPIIWGRWFASMYPTRSVLDFPFSKYLLYVPVLSSPLPPCPAQSCFFQVSHCHSHLTGFPDMGLGHPNPQGCLRGGLLICDCPWVTSLLLSSWELSKGQKNAQLDVLALTSSKPFAVSLQPPNMQPFPKGVSPVNRHLDYK